MRSNGKDATLNEIVLIGDSIRIGYQGVVRREIGAAAQVWGPEENGGTSRNVLAHLDPWVISRRPKVVHLNCGLHDVRRPSGAPQPEVPPDEYRANLTEIFRRIRDETDAILIWATTTPVNQKFHLEAKGFDRYEADVAAYNRESVAIADGLGLRVNDLFEAVVRAGRDRLLDADGVHFSEAGYELLGKAVADVVRAAAQEAG